MFGSAVYTSDGESVGGSYILSGDTITGCMAGGNCLSAEYSLTDNILVINMTDPSGFGFKAYLERVL
jgi:hypothetical protein